MAGDQIPGAEKVGNSNLLLKSVIIPSGPLDLRTLYSIPPYQTRKVNTDTEGANRTVIYVPISVGRGAWGVNE